MNAAEALHHFDTSAPLRDVAIDDELSTDPAGAIDCLRCSFSSFSTPCVQFFNSVHFDSCTFRLLDFYAAYFFCGLTIENCSVVQRCSFQSGGHNDHGDITIRDTVFKSFVDFEDCWFTGAICLENVSFQAGTNLLGNRKTPVEVAFDIPPKISDVAGDLYVDTYTGKKRFKKKVIRASGAPEPWAMQAYGIQHLKVGAGDLGRYGAYS